MFSSSRDEVRRSEVTSGGASFKMDRTCLEEIEGGGGWEKKRVREIEKEMKFTIKQIITFLTYCVSPSAIASCRVHSSSQMSIWRGA